MAIDTETMRNALVDAYKARATHFALHSGDATAANEITGGTYTRELATWGATASSAATASPPAFDVPSGVTVAGAGAWDAASAGTFLDGATLPSQPFNSAGTYTLQATYTQS